MSCKDQFVVGYLGARTPLQERGFAVRSAYGLNYDWHMWGFAAIKPLQYAVVEAGKH